MAKQRKRRRTKRRTNLGGTPAEHLREARNAIKWVGNKLRHAEQALKGGQCDSAFFALTNARRELGRAQGAFVGHTGWAGQENEQRKRLHRHLDRLDRVIYNTSQKFLKSCSR